MHNEHWSEGQSWSCLPHAVACFALTFWIQANVGVAWSGVPLAMGLAFMACESGFVWDTDALRGRSYTEISPQIGERHALTHADRSVLVAFPKTLEGGNDVAFTSFPPDAGDGLVVA